VVGGGWWQAASRGVSNVLSRLLSTLLSKVQFTVNDATSRLEQGSLRTTQRLESVLLRVRNSSPNLPRVYAGALLAANLLETVIPSFAISSNRKLHQDFFSDAPTPKTPKRLHIILESLIEPLMAKQAQVRELLGV
jgi:hypothetical protein